MKPLSYQVRTTELGDTALRLVTLFKHTPNIQTDNFLSETITKIEQQANALTSAIKRDTVLSNLEEADAERDNAIRILDKLLKGYENIPVENLRNHAHKLIEIFSKYGIKITTENYTSQSALIESLLQDFSAESLTVSIDALVGIRESIANIRAKQDAFISIRAGYEQALATQKEKASASSFRKPLLELINKKVIPYLIAMNIAQSELFKEFVGKASEIVSSTNEVVKSRTKKSTKATQKSAE